jgi:fatty-acyl-CoA synthase
MILSSLTKAYYGASIMPGEVLRELRERLPDLRLWNFYGQTEIAPVATVLFPHEHADRPGSCGRPVLHVSTRVVDDDMRDVAPGEIGEVVPSFAASDDRILEGPRTYPGSVRGRLVP